MKSKGITFFLSLALCPPTMSFADDKALQACVEIYKNSTRDYSQTQQTSVELARSFSSFCEKDGSVNTSATGIGLDAIVSSIPFKFSLSSTSSQQKMTEFCKIGSTQFDSWNSGSVSTSTVVTGALSNFNNCVQLANSGLQLSVSINQPDTLVVNGYATAGYSGSISSVAYDVGPMSCVSSDFNASHREQTIHGAVHLSTQQPFAITCTKKAQPAADKSTTYYPRTNLTIAAGAVPALAIVFPSDSLNGYELASQAQLAVSRAAADVKQAKADTASQMQLAADLQRRLNGVSATIVTHQFGSGMPWGCGPYGSDWGRGVHEEAQRTCGSSPIVFGNNEVRSGGTCGYGTWAYACINIPQ
jgi:hypothetical protein